MARPKKKKDLDIDPNTGESGGRGETPSQDLDEEVEVQKWHETISGTLDWRYNISKKGRWEDIYKEYKGDWGAMNQAINIDLIPINLIYAFVKTDVANLYFRDPWITVNPKKMEDLGGAELTENLINYKWGELNLKHEIKRGIIDADLVGHGWIKLGYSADIGIAEDKSEKEDSKEVVQNEFIKDEEIFAYHVPWKDVLFSPDSLRPPYDSRWLAFRVVKPLRAIKESGIYENTDDLKPSIESRPEEKTKDKDVRKMVETGTLWEIWDMDHKKVKTIAEGGKKFLRVIDWPYKQMKGFPAVRIHFNVTDEAYPMSDMQMAEAQIIEMMKMVAIMINHLKRWNRLIFMKEGFMTQLEIDKFEKGIDGSVVKYQGNQDTEFFIPPYAPVQQDIYGVYNLVKDLYQTVIGQTNTQRGGKAVATTRTLGELKMQDMGGRSRSDEKLDMLEDQISEIASKLIAIMREKMTIPQIVRVVGKKAIDSAILKNRPSFGMPGSYTSNIPTQNPSAPMTPGMPTAPGIPAGQSQPQIPGMSNLFQSYSYQGIDIPEQLDIDTVAGSTVPLNKENKLNIMSEFFKIFFDTGVLAPGSQAARELMSEVLREVDIKELERIKEIADQEAKIPKPNPEAQKMQAEMQQKQLESQSKLQAESVRAQATMAVAKSQITQAQIQQQIANVKLQDNILKHLMERYKTQKELVSSTMPPANGETNEVR